MPGLDLDKIFVLLFVIICADPTRAGSKKKDLSRFTQSFDLVSALQRSLRRNNDDYQDGAPAASAGARAANLTTDADTNSREDDGNSIHYARRLIRRHEVTNSFMTATKFIDKVRISLLKEASRIQLDENPNVMNSIEEIKTDIKDSNVKSVEIENSDEKESKPRFMKSLEEIKIDNKKPEETQKKMRTSQLHFMKSLEEIKTDTKHSNNKPEKIENKSNNKKSPLHFMKSLEEVEKTDTKYSNKKSEEKDNKPNEKYWKPNFMKSLEETKRDISASNKKPSDTEKKWYKKRLKPYFMKSLEDIKVENKNSNKKPKENKTKPPENLESKLVDTGSQRDMEMRAKFDNEEKEPETTATDSWFEVISPIRTTKPASHETSLAPYLLGRETTTRLVYKVLTVKRDREFRRSGVPRAHFVQTELGSGVVVAPVGVLGVMPDFRLPKSRRQFRVDSDDENAEGSSAVSGDDDALVPR